MTTHPALAPACILVVEDDRPVREMACLILGGAGYEVVAAGSAEDGLVVAEERAFDALFCDVMLPGASGLDLAADLRSRRPDLPVLMTSGQRSADVRDALSQAGHPFLAKPYTASALRAAVDALLHGDLEASG